MPRVTRHGPSRAVLRAGAIGYDPDTATGDVPTPPDYADDAGWTFPGATTAAEDLNVAHGTMSSFHTGAYGYTPSNPAYVIDDLHDTQSNRGAFAGSGGAAITWGWSTDLGIAYTVYSLEVYEPANWAWQTPGPYVTALVVEGSADGSSWTDAPYAVTTGTFTNNGVSGGTRNKKIYTLTTPASYRYWRIKKSQSTSGFEFEDAMSELKVYGEVVVAAVWLPTFAVNDGSNTTYEQVDDGAVTITAGPFARGILPVDVVLASATLRVGLENAGSATIKLQGATLADYSDAVDLGSVTFTATGSYTSDTLTFTLPATTGYQYLQFVLTTTAQGVRPYEVTLNGLPDPATTIAAHTADTLDAHDASAVSLLDTAGNTTATDVEAAIAELFGLADIWRPVMAHDGTNWYVVVAGDGTAVMTQG